jgi:hypothetical protein
MPGTSLVCANFDGASVMQGRKGNVVAHILQEISKSISMHCIAHKLGSVKSIPFLQKYEEVLPPKRMRA